jgi:CheY-specific phosphatase CheX
MTDSIAGHLPPSCEQVLETMFFTAILSQEDRTGREPSGACLGAITAAVEFHGPPKGILCAGMEIETAAALASSFLGLDPEAVTAADCRQVAGELANMICGSVLSRSAPQSQLRLAAPQIAEGRGVACGRACDTRVSFTLPEGALNICIGVVRAGAVSPGAVSPGVVSQ